MDKSNLTEIKESTLQAVECCDLCGKRMKSPEEGASNENCCICKLPGQKAQSQPAESHPADEQTADALNKSDFPDLGDRYEVLNQIGQGGMGAVYKVKDKAIGKEFAVKVMNPCLVQDKVSVKRFEQEAQAAKSLTHANLAAVYSFGVSKAGSPYLVMDYLDGQTLEQTLKCEGFLDAPRALDIFIQAGEAIAEAHLKGVIHRDIKPSNIILEKRASVTGQDIDFVKLVDFGIAKVLPSQEKAYENLTQTGDIFGSPLYMSPEQCQGNMQDRRSDIYSLGCVMYEALTGIQPYGAENPIKIILKHIHDDPQSINTLKNDYKIPPDLDKVIMHCLQREPDDRYQSADELVRDLRKIRDGAKVQIKSPVKKKPEAAQEKKQRLVITALAAAAIGMATIFSLSWHQLAGGLNSYSDAQDFDSKAFSYYVHQEYDKAAPLLEFGVPTYKEHVAQDLARGDKQAALKDRCLLAENWQHIGKCHFMAAKKALAGGDKATANVELKKALDAYQQAMPFYYEHGNWPGGSTPEAVQGYASVLQMLNMASEFAQLKSYASTWHIHI